MLSRSSGQRGASVETLRGTLGADFEGKATVSRGDTGGCNCFGGGSSDTKEKFILVKGPFCFVFAEETAQAPKYAISLAHLKAAAREPINGHTVVTLETNLGDIEYEIGFMEEKSAKEFATEVTQQAAIGEAEIVRKVST